MESPFNRPKAVNLIDRALDAHLQSVSQGNYGSSRAMAIYLALIDAGYLTDEAMKEDPR